LDLHDEPERGIQFILTEDLERLGMKKDYVSAAMIPRGYEAIFFEYDAFNGES
jgi:hypothetical protein